MIANEMVCSSEALDTIDQNSGAGVSKIHNWVRTIVSPLESDRSMTQECEALSKAIVRGDLSRIFG